MEGDTWLGQVLVLGGDMGWKQESWKREWNGMTEMY